MNKAIADADERILYLRTFRGGEVDHIVIVMVALATAGIGRVWVIGSPKGKLTLHDYWDQLFKGDLQFEHHIDYVESDDESWRSAVHQRISEASCIVLHLSPKDDDFPELKLPETPTATRFMDQMDEYYRAPLMRPSSGSGLLYEVAFLSRLDSMRRTVLLCAESDLKHIQTLISSAHAAGMDIFRRDGSRLEPWRPRLTALDNQLIELKNVHSAVTYSQENLGGLRKSWLTRRWKSRLVFTLNLELRKVLVHTWRTGDSPAINYATLLGKSPKPRRLPPDGELKVIQFSNVEDLLIIPRGELIEVNRDDVRRLLSAEALGRGCPYCQASVDDIFFHHDGLEIVPTPFIRGKCQRCGRQSAVENDTLVDI